VLLVIELGDASQPDLSSFDRWQHDVHAVQLRKPFQHFRWRAFRTTALQQMFECHQQGIAQKGDQHVCLHSLFELMEERSNGQLTLERAKLEEDFQEESKSRRFMTCTANDVL